MPSMAGEIGQKAQVEGLQREMQRNIAKQQRSPASYVSGATPTDVKQLQGLLDSHTGWGNEALTRDRGVEDQYRGAVSEGFRGPNPVMEQAQYGRSMAEEKMRQPVRQEEVQQQGLLAQQKEQSRGALDVAKENQRGAMDIQSNFADLQRFLSEQGGQQNLSGVTLPGRSGGGSMRFAQDRPVPTAYGQTAVAAQRAFENDPSSVNRVARDQAVNNVLASSPVSPDVRDTILEAINNPVYDSAAVDDMIGDDWTDQEANEFRTLMLQIGRR